METERYRRRTLALFTIVSVVPALVVGAIWYVYDQSSQFNFLLLDFKSFVLPVILVGILPALLLSVIFAELLTKPIRRIHKATIQLARGDFRPPFDTHPKGEFSEIAVSLNQVAITLEQKLSETVAETQLITAERNKLRGVLNSMTDGVFALDQAGRIILFNKAASELTGRSIEEVAGQLAEKVMPFREKGEVVITRRLASQHRTDHRLGEWKGLELYRSDGQSLFVDVQAIILHNDPNGIATLVTFHDLTKIHQLEEMKVDFVALAAHELRTPLTEINGYLDILNHEAKGLSRSNREFLTQAIISANHLNSLMHNLLNVARVEHGELGYRPSSINYADLVASVQGEMQQRAKQMNRTLTFKVQPRLPHIIADADALREVLVNLIDNALRYTQAQDGTITVSVRHNLSDIETSVQDNGKGIPADAIPHLFTKFYRVDEMKSRSRGTGLGLYICKSIIDAHNGHIWVESTEGQGSVFKFRLPITPVAHPVPTDDNDTTIVTKGSHGWIKENPVHRRRQTNR